MGFRGAVWASAWGWVEDRGAADAGAGCGSGGASEPRLCGRDGEEGADLREVKAVDSRCFHDSLFMAWQWLAVTECLMHAGSKLSTPMYELT